jgi:hypothetical protein
MVRRAVLEGTEWEEVRGIGQRDNSLLFPIDSSIDGVCHVLG